MSDSECESVVNTPTQRVKTPASASRPTPHTATTNISRSDSEWESASQAPTTANKKPVTTSKRKTQSSGTNKSRTQRKKQKTLDVFGLCEDDIDLNELKAEAPCQLPSYIVNRVANGNQRRLASTSSGEFYVDVKVYARDDAENTAKETRWTKALLRLNCYLGEDTTQWKALKRFVKEVDVFYKDSVPTFYSDAVKIRKT